MSTSSVPDLLRPSFEKVVIDNIEDGYWLGTCDVNGDGRPDLVASGLGLGEVVWYENPGWKKHLITKLPQPVAWDYADIDGDGRLDVVICHDFGTCPRNCKPEHGKISWLKNPGRYGSDEKWEVHFIADLMATHRVKIGHFTQNRSLEVFAFPVVGPGDIHTPCKLTLYPVPADVGQARGWQAVPVDDSSFTFIHDALIGKFGSRAGSDLDSALLCSGEGITWLSFGSDGRWHQAHLGSGAPARPALTVFKGTGSVAVGRIGDDPFAYIAALEPFHGDAIAVYCKDAASLTDVRWTRRVLDIVGEPNKVGEGVGHHVVAADFDGDGDDEFLVGLRGPMPYQGVFYYKAVDVQRGWYVKTQLSSASTSIIAVADFDGDGRLDFATTGYHTPGFFLADNPQTLMFLNRFGRVPPAISR